MIMKVTDGAKVFIRNKKLNKFLLVLRDNKPDIIQPNTWGLIGGGIDEGETPEQTLKRELEEESNIKAFNIRYLGRQEFVQTFLEKKYNITGNFFLAETQMYLKDIEIYEGQRVEYFTLDEILKMDNIAGIIKEMIQRFKTELY